MDNQKKTLYIGTYLNTPPPPSLHEKKNDKTPDIELFEQLAPFGRSIINKALVSRSYGCINNDSTSLSLTHTIK